MRLGEESIPARHKHPRRYQPVEEPVIPLLGLPTRPIHPRWSPRRHRLNLLLLLPRVHNHIRPQVTPEVGPNEKAGVAPFTPGDVVLAQEGGEARVAGGEAGAVLGEIVGEEGAVGEEGRPVVFRDGGGPGEDGHGFEGLEQRGVGLGEEDAAAEAVAGEVFGHAVEDVDAVGVDYAGGVDGEDGGEGGRGGVGGGLVNGHGVDFVGDEVDVVVLTEAHVGF